MLQRLLLTLAVPPLLVLGTPRPVIARLTRPAAVDAVLRVVGPPGARRGHRHGGGRRHADRRRREPRRALAGRPGRHRLLVLASGFVLWAPVLTELPGAQRLSALGRGGYLIVQSIVPSFLSIVWIFARHSLYPTFTHTGTVVGMTPLLDQELAGFLAKLSTIAVLWTVAFVIMTRAQAAETAGEDAEPLVWSDVEREIERADRRDRRQGSPGPPPPGLVADGGA